jgi:hypothetical protein
MFFAEAPKTKQEPNMSAKQLPIPNGGLPTATMILGRDPRGPVPTCRVVRRSDAMSTWEEWRQVPILEQSNSRPRRTKPIG